MPIRYGNGSRIYGYPYGRKTVTANSPRDQWSDPVWDYCVCDYTLGLTAALRIESEFVKRKAIYDQI